MRDYDATVKNLREAAKGLLFDAMPYRASVMKDAADAVADFNKMVNRIEALIEKMQNKADESREAEKYHYGSDAKVSTYTWMHNSKCIYERFVRDLEDLILPMEEGANEDR